jgi:hypothetical protein
MKISSEDVVEAYGAFVADRIETGFDAHLLTFMFNPLPGNMASRRQLMMEEVRATYYKGLTRWFHRHPDKAPRHDWPVWIASPDLPVSKQHKDTYRNLAVNDGLHLHAIAVTPPVWRSGEPDFPDFIDENQPLWAGEDRNLFRVHCEPINSRPEYVVGYGLKAISNGVMPMDDLLILPDATSERPTRTRWERQQAKVDGECRRRTPRPHDHQLSAEAEKTIPPHGLT